MIRVLALASLVSFAVAPRIAVMPVRGDASGAAERTVRDALAHENVKLVDKDAVTKLIASAAHNGITCDAGDAACAARICAFGGLDFALVADVSERGRASIAFSDCSDGRELRTINARLDDASHDDGLAMLARAALGDGEARGRIDVQAPAGGVVVVDGVERGPAPPPIDVPVGVHDVAWRDASGAAHTQSVDVPAASSVRVSFRDPIATSSSITSAGDANVTTLAAGALALGAAGAIVGGVGALVIAPGDRASVTARAYNDDVLTGRVLLGVGVAGGVLAAVAGAVLLVDGAP